MAVTVGTVYVDVMPTTRDFVKKMVADLLDEADRAGRELGEKLGEAMGRQAGKAAREGIEEGVKDAKTEPTAAKKGKETGGAFARSFRAEVQAALRDLPDIDIDADPAGALADIAIIRSQLHQLSKQKIGVDLDADDALRSIAEIRAQLQEISDRDIDVDFDVREAMKSLGQLEDRMRRAFQDRQGSFARDLRSAIDNAVRALPEIEITADTTDAERDIGTIRALLAELGDKRIDIDISTPELLRELAQIEAMLSTIEGPHTVRVQADLDAARAALARFVQDAEEEGRRSGGAFMERMRTELARASAALPDIRVDADTAPAVAQVAALRERLASLSARIGVDVDAAGALAELASLQAIAEALDRDDIDIDVRVDLRNVIAQLTALTAATRVADAALDNAVGSRAVGRVGRFRLILAAVAALLPIIAGAVVALPAAFAAVVGPVLAISAGVGGITRSFAELTPEIEAVRESTSAAFEQSLEPTIDRLHVAIPRLRDDLAETAFAVSEVANRITELVTSGANLDAIETNFSLIDAAVLNAIPGLELLTQNIITLTTIGLRGMVGLGEEMRQVGELWAGVIARLQASGAAEAAVRALFQVLAELLGLIAGLTEFGAVLAATFGPALAALISGLTAVFSTFAQGIDSLPGLLQTVAAAATTVGLVMLVLGGRITAAATAMRVGLIAAATSVATTFTAAHARVVALGASITGLGVASRIAAPALAAVAAGARALWLAVGGPVGAAITGIVIALSLLGNQQSNAAAAADQHKVAVQELADALRTSGGVIDSNVILLTRQNIEAAGATTAMDQLGLSMAEVSHAVSMGGPAYDQLIAHLQGVVEAGTEMAFSGTEVRTTLSDEALAAQGLIEQLGGLRDGFGEAAEQNRRLGEALFQAGNSMVSGVANAKALEEAQNTLADAMSSVEDRAKALYIALIQLSGQALPLGLAQGALGQATRELATAFDEFGVATKESGDALLDNTGKINVASEAGYKLTQAVEGQVKAMTDSATAAFEAAGGMNNIEAASAAAAREAQFAREAFIGQAREMGLTAVQAGELADSYGLIPSEVVTLLRAQGIPQVQQDILQINQLLAGLPPNTTINIGVPAQETIAQLQSIGAEITQLPDGTFTITLNDQPALDRFNGLVNTIEHPPTIPGLPTDLNRTPADASAAELNRQLNAPADGGPKLPVGVNPQPLQQELPGVQGQITGAPPSGLPTELNAQAVPGQIGNIQQEVLRTVATMPINPIKGSGWDADLLAIRNSVTLAVAQMPIDAMKSPNFDAQIQFIKTTLAQGIAATLPIDPVQSPNWIPALNTIKASLSLPPYAALLIDVARAPTWATSLAAIVGPLSLPPYSLILVDVARAPTWAASLAAIVGPLQLPPYTALLLVPAKAPTWQATLDAIRNELIVAPLVWTIVADAQPIMDTITEIYNFVVPVPLIWTIVADAQPIMDTIIAIYNFVVPVPLIWTIVADPAPIIQTINDIATWIANNPLIWQIIPQVSGGLFGGGGGGGGTGGGTAFAAKGVYLAAMARGGFRPMSSDVARIVPPRTWRLIGDRMHGDESFIPINSSTRSHTILERTAARMGRTILPQQSGSFMTQGTRSFSGQSTWGTQETTWRQGEAPLIGQVVAPDGASATELADEVMFRLRISQYGGVNGVRR